MKITAYPTGQITAFDDNGQVPELQVCWPILWAEHVAKKGFDPVGKVIESEGHQLVIVAAINGFNYIVL